MGKTTYCTERRVIERRDRFAALMLDRGLLRPDAPIMRIAPSARTRNPKADLSR
jgi:hypothetical protein